jgi:outer membrane biosynthesis protein TonB
MKLPGARPPANRFRSWWEIAKREWRFSVMAVVCLLPFLFAGCSHKPQPEPLAPPIEDAPPPKPAPSPTHLPPPVITIPKEAPEPNSTESPKPAPALPVRKKRHAPPSATPPPIARPSVSAIGQLSSGDPSDLQRQTADSIVTTEQRVNALNRPLSDQEKKTARQIKEFLKQAHAALKSGDVDGAHTLSVKAKVLLGELSQ